MRHKYNKLKKLNTWVQKQENVIRNLLTSLVSTWQLVTTPKRAKVLKSRADNFFSRLVRITKDYPDANDARREVIRYIKSVIYTDEWWKKVLNDLLPANLKAENASFVSNYKLWVRPWDNSEKILVKLI